MSSYPRHRGPQVAIRNPRQLGAGGDALAHLHRHLLQHAGDAGAHPQPVELAAAQLVGRP